ncbi:MAG TPA: hypothetical protein VFS40_03550 [Gemmatimonadales bacterium]|nr:hypothetical protein [Gemmatimonadales bacterium]
MTIDASEGLDPPFPGGRRLLVERDAAGGLAAVWAEGRRLLHAPRLAVAGADVPLVPVDDARDAGGYQVLAFAVPGPGAMVHARWLAALDLPVLVWELESGDERPIRLEWRSDTADLIVMPDAGALERSDGGTYGVAGNGCIRFTLIAASSAGDLDRTRQLLARRGLAGLASGRAQRAKLLREYAVSIETPEPARDRAFEAAKRRLDDTRVELPGWGRGWVGVTAPRDPVALADAAATAYALLVAGVREPARDLLRLAAAVHEREGGLPTSATPDGRLAREPAAEAETARALLRLAGAYRDWSGDADGLTPAARLLAVARTVADAAARTASGGPGAPESPGPPEALWLPAHPALRRAADGVLREVIGRWGVRPEQGAEAAEVTLDLPADWPRAALRRLRLGATVLDLLARRRFGRVHVVVTRAHGPPLRLALALAGAVPGRLTVDDVELGGATARFAADATHEVRFEW